MYYHENGSTSYRFILIWYINILFFEIFKFKWIQTIVVNSCEWRSFPLKFNPLSFIFIHEIFFMKGIKVNR